MTDEMKPVSTQDLRAVALYLTTGGARAGSFEFDTEDGRRIRLSATEVGGPFDEALSAPSSPGDGCPEPAAVWRVCRVIKPECQKCPASELIDGEAFQRGCYLQAVEVINTVQTGNPWRKTADELGPSKIWTAYTAAPSSLGDGWVVVPREPTDAMIDAPRKIILDDRMRANNGRTKAGLAIDIYRAMLSAAPSPGGDHGA